MDVFIEADEIWKVLRDRFSAVKKQPGCVRNQIGK